MAVATATAIAAASVAASVAGTVVGATAGGGSAPKPPNYAKQIMKGNAAEQAVLPDKIRSELAARQQFDLPALLQSLGYMDVSNTGIQEQRLSAAEAFAPREIQQRKALVDMADPGKLEARDEVGRMVLEELKKGRDLTTAQSQSLRDTVRGRQVSSGITDGSMPVLEEGLAMERYKDEMRSRRLSEAGSFLAMPSLAETTPCPTVTASASTTPTLGSRRRTTLPATTPRRPMPLTVLMAGCRAWVWWQVPPRVMRAGQPINRRPRLSRARRVQLTAGFPSTDYASKRFPYWSQRGQLPRW